MIPYEDLVVALQSWRAKQGLPVVEGQAPAASSSAGSGGTQAPAPEAYEQAYEPSYEAAESLEVADELVEDASYGAVESAGDDATSIGQAPQRGDYEENPTELASESGQLGNQREDW